MDRRKRTAIQREILGDELVRFERATLTTFNDIKLIFELIESVAATGQGLRIDHASQIARIADNLFKRNVEVIQIETFRHMREIIATTGEVEPHTLPSKGPILLELLRFYTSSVPYHALRPRLFTKAARHLAQFSQSDHPYRSYALRAFHIATFAQYRLETFETEAVECLLIIATEKAMRNSDTSDTLMPGMKFFLERICDEDVSCEIAIRICYALKYLYEALTNRKEILRTMLIPRPSYVFETLRKHLDSTRATTFCREAVLEIMKTSATCADGETHGAFMNSETFTIIRNMFCGHRTDAISVRLLQVVEAVCMGQSPGTRCMERVSFIMGLVVPCINDSDAVRCSAFRAFQAFVDAASIELMCCAVLSGAVNELLTLMKSSDDQVVLISLRCFFLLVEKLLEAPVSYKWFKGLVIEHDKNRILRKLSHSRYKLIEAAATIILCRLEEEAQPLETLSDEKKDIRFSQIRFFRENIPTFQRLGIVAEP